MLKTIYQKADEKTVQKTYASVQQSLATMTTHLGSTLNTRSDHPDNREGAETCPRPEDVDLEEVSIHFLRAYSIHPNWKQIISSCNDYGQTVAHITVALGHLRLLRHLFTWEIDFNVVDNLGLTALHYAYLFKQGDCAKFLIQSGVNQFILDDLGRSPSDLEPSLEVGLHSTIGIDSDSHADGASLIECNTEMPDKMGKPYAKRFLVQQWMRRDEDERTGGMPPSRCQSLEILDRPSMASSPQDVPNHPFPPVCVPSPGENSTLIVVKEGMDFGASIEMAAPPDIDLPLSPISEASVLSQESDRPSDIGQNTLSHPAPLNGAITTPDLEQPQRNSRILAFQPFAHREPSLVPTARSARSLLPDTPKEIRRHDDTNDEKSLQRSAPCPSAGPHRYMPGSSIGPSDAVTLDSAREGVWQFARDPPHTIGSPIDDPASTPVNDGTAGQHAYDAGSVSAPHLEVSTMANVSDLPHRTPASPQVMLFNERGHSLALDAGFAFTPFLAVPSQSDSVHLCICDDDYWFACCSLAWEHYNAAMNSLLPLTQLPCTCQPGLLNGTVPKSCPKATDHLLTWVSYVHYIQRQLAYRESPIAAQI